MKKYFFGIAAVILAVGISAFTSNKSKSTSVNDFHWYTTTPDGSSLISYLGHQSKDATIEDTQCDDVSEDFCARGYDALQNIVLPAQPSPESVMEDED